MSPLPQVLLPGTGNVSQDSGKSAPDRRACPPPPWAAQSQLSGQACPWRRPLTRRDHLHLGAAAHGLASAVGAACVGALVSGLQLVDQQCAIRGLVDTVPVSPHRQPIPGGEKTLGELARAQETKGGGNHCGQMTLKKEMGQGVRNSILRAK